MEPQISTTVYITTIEPALTESGRPYTLATFTHPNGTKHTQYTLGEPIPHQGCSGGGLMVWVSAPWSNDGTCTGCDISIYSPIGD